MRFPCSLQFISPEVNSVVRSRFTCLYSSFLHPLSLMLYQCMHFYYLGHVLLCSISFKCSLRNRLIIDQDFTLVSLSFPYTLFFPSLLLIKLAKSFFVLRGQLCYVAVWSSIVAPILDGYPLEIAVSFLCFII